MATISLIASDRIWFKSMTGYSFPASPRTDSFANHVIELPDPSDMFVVLDTQTVEKYGNYPLVKNSPHIRFYAGTPIVVEGYLVGSLCVYDSLPRKRLSVTARMNLMDFAHSASILLTERRNRIISKTSSIDRLVSHLLHDSLSQPLQEMTSALYQLHPGLSDTPPSRAMSINIDINVPGEGRSPGVTESLLRQSRSLLEEATEPAIPLIACDDIHQPITQDSNVSSHPHCDSIHDMFVALCQLSSLVGLKTSSPNSPRPSFTHIDEKNNDPHHHNGPSLSHQRPQVPLRYTTVLDSLEYLQDDHESNLRTPLLSLLSNIPSNSFNSSTSTLFSDSSKDSQSQPHQRVPTPTNHTSGRLSSDLHNMLTYLQHILPVSVSNYRTIWKINLPDHLFQNPQCSQTKCVIHLVDVLTNLLETVMTHIIMRTKQLEVTVTMDMLSDGNDVKQEYDPTNSKGYLLNETIIHPAELFLTIKATGYTNTFYGGHVTIEPRHESPRKKSGPIVSAGEISSPLITTQEAAKENDIMTDVRYDFFVDNVAIQDILSPLGVRTIWKLEEGKEASEGGEKGIGTETSNRISNPKNEVFEGNDILEYQVIVPCRVEMTYLPPEEIEGAVRAAEREKKQTTLPSASTTSLETKESRGIIAEPQISTPTGVAAQTAIETSPISHSEPPTSTPAPSVPMAPQQSKLSVLIVDDSPAIQKILGKWLQRNDCEVVCALNGQLGVEALQASVNHPFDLVFMDFLMPVMDGLEAVKTFRQWRAQSPQEIAEKFAQTLIIGLSATANVSEQQEGLEVGMHYFIQKPADTKLLRVIIDWKLQGHDIKDISERLKAGVTFP